MNKNFIITNTIILSLMFSGCMRTASKPQAEAPKQAMDTVVSAPIAEAVKPKENDAARILAKPEVPVLCYHRIADGKKGDYTVTQATFSEHMKILADSGYQTISPAQLYDYLVYNHELPAKPVMITFDDSRSEHSEIAAPVMDKVGFKGVFFIMTITYNKKNYMTTEQIAGLAKAGNTIGLHSWDHTMVPKYKEEADWQKQVVAPKEKLEKIVESPVEFWAYPNGVYDHKGAEQLNKHFKLSFTLFSKRDTIYPLQTVRRIIVPDYSGEKLLKSIRRTFGKEQV
ncbi:MAG TPA: polysaccharide deacetylase family protein [Prolixibacteraceae bacterium]|nr:polysaccharide deacetylase family protein [Prolixibacteraceae bacterium]